MKRVIALLLLAAAGQLLAGCNTVNGFGKDLEKVGDKIQSKSSR